MKSAASPTLLDRLIDIGANLSHAAFDPDLDAVVGRALAAAIELDPATVAATTQTAYRFLGLP